MGEVTSLPAARDKQIMEVLRHYLMRSEQGTLRGLSICAKDASGKEEIVVVGDYLRHPAEGVNASVRMTIKLATIQDTSKPRSGWRPL
jgi:hypothetical protein